MSTAPDRAIVARHRWPLNQHRSHMTPGYYSDLVKPIYAWTMDDVLEHAVSEPATRLDVHRCVQFLSNLHPSRQRGLDRIVQYSSVDHIPLLSQEVTPFCNRLLMLLDMLSKYIIGLPPEETPGLISHPDPDETRFPSLDPDDSYVVLHKPIWHFGIEHALRRQEEKAPGSMRVVRAYLENLTILDKLRLDHMVDSVAEAYEPRIHDALIQFSDRICHFINEGMAAAINDPG